MQILMLLLLSLSGPELQVDPQYARDKAIVIQLDTTGMQAHWLVTGDSVPDILQLPNGIAIWGKPGNYQVICIVADTKNPTNIVWYDLRAKFQIVGSLEPVSKFPEITKSIRAVLPVAEGNETKTLVASFEENTTLQDYDQVKLFEITQNNIASDFGINRFLKWKPVFSIIRAESKNMKTKQDWVAFWLAVAAGIK